MKHTLLTIAFGIAFSSSLFASEPKCANEAVKAAVTKNYKTFKVSTSSTGIKALDISEHAETYIVATSDETDPMEYVVVLETVKYNRKTKVSTPCAVVAAVEANDAQTPHFDDDKGLIKNAVECTVEFGDGEVICR